MLNTAFTPLRREDPALLMGRGQYTGDVPAEGALHAVFVRSPIPHGRLRSIDLQAAESAEGVAAVLTAETLLPDAEEGRAVHMPPPNPLLPVAPVLAIEPLARGEVVYVGQPVALVLAHTLGAAQQAALRVQLDIEPLDAVLDFDGTLPVSEVAHHAGEGVGRCRVDVRVRFGHRSLLGKMTGLWAGLMTGRSVFGLAIPGALAYRRPPGPPPS